MIYKERPIIGIAGSTQQSKSRDRWRTTDDEKRCKQVENQENLYLGKHCTLDGGPFLHPYGYKATRDKIPYVQFNILGKCSRVFADLIGGVTVNTESPLAKGVLGELDFSLNLWQALIKTSYSGIIGLQPIQTDNGWNYAVIDPRNLYLEHRPGDGKLIRIYKRVVFSGIDIGNGKTIDILFQETHEPGMVKTDLFWIDGENVIEQLDLTTFAGLLGDDFQAPADIWETGLDGFMITPLYNDRLGNVIIGDYTETAVRLQEALNSRLTQVNRILGIHADPKLIAPRTVFQRDPVTGEMVWTGANSEVLVYDQGGGVPFSYLTWDGQITSAVENKRDMILALLTEMDVAPHLLSFTDLVGGTVAETSAKLEKMMHSTLKKASRKQQELDNALRKLISDILSLSGLPGTEFSLDYAEFVPMSRDEILSEVLQRKSAGLISIWKALMWLDNLTEAEARQVAADITADAQNSMTNPFRTKFNLGEGEIVAD